MQQFFLGRPDGKIGIYSPDNLRDMDRMIGLVMKLSLGRLLWDWARKGNPPPRPSRLDEGNQMVNFHPRGEVMAHFGSNLWTVPERGQTRICSVIGIGVSETTCAATCSRSYVVSRDDCVHIERVPVPFLLLIAAATISFARPRFRYASATA